MNAHANADINTREKAGPHTAEPVFLHGLWRSGSTYVWSRFREQAQDTVCYYEPLQPGLAKLTQKRIGHFRKDRAAVNRHPVMDRPFFYEFSDLIRPWGRGVKRAKKSFEWTNFILPPAQKYTALKRYIGGLAAHAADHKKIPVFGFNRTVLRIGWFAHNWPGGCNLYIDRDPYDVWCSYERQVRVRGNYTFYYSWLRILEANAAHPLIKPLAERLPLRGGLQKLVSRRKRYYRPRLEAMRPQDRYGLVFYLWALGALHALSCKDILVLDMNRVSEPRYTGRITSAVRKKSGVAVSFDALEDRAADPGALAARPRKETEAAAGDLMKPLLQAPLFDTARIRDNLSYLSPDKAARLPL